MKVRGDPAPDFQSAPMTAAAVLESMERNKTVSAGAREPFHVLQSRIILGRTNDALIHLAQWVAESAYVSLPMRASPSVCFGQHTHLRNDHAGHSRK